MNIVTSAGGNAPDWDLEQLEVIMEAPTAWQLVVAGPGAGKSAAACQRIAYLIDEGVPPSRILLVSFTRTAVAELRDRIVSYAVAGERARSVRISTIDSHAWSLRTGFDDEPLPTVVGDGSYDLSIARTVELFRDRQPDLCDFMSRLEHLIIDEAQDVMGVRADLIVEMLCSLAESCGLTIFADPAQAIYGFTTDDEVGKQEASLLARLETECPRPLFRRKLTQIHRIKNTGLVELFLRTRKEIEHADTAAGHVSRVQQAIRDTCGNDVGVTRYSSLPDFLTRIRDESMLVLFRRRADVIFASSYCSEAGIQHRLRMSDLPIVVRPWLGWLFGAVGHAIVGRDDFDRLWEARGTLASQPFDGEQRDESWNLIHRLAAGHRPRTIDLVQLRRLVARARPPIELCYPDLGSGGPILGTIHASKGREADMVVLVMPPPHERGDDFGVSTDSAAAFEEGRVYYVGATRARKILVTAGSTSTRVGYLDSRRVYHLLGPMKAQLEIGREGDVDPFAHLAWSNGVQVQGALASCAGGTTMLHARAIAEDNYALRLILEQKGTDGVTRYIEIGQLSESFRYDQGKLWSCVDPEQKLKPSDTIRHLYLVAVTSVGLSEEQCGAVKPPFNQSGLALAPVIKGFPMIQFYYRKWGRNLR